MPRPSAPRPRSARPSGTIPAQQQRSRETERRLLAAFRDVIVRSGVADATVAEICREAGVAVGTFYGRFRDKDALLTAFFAGYYRQPTAELEAAFPLEAWRGRPVAEIVAAWIDHRVESFRERRAQIRAVLTYTRSHPDPAFRAAAAEFSALVIDRFTSLLEGVRRRHRTSRATAGGGLRGLDRRGPAQGAHPLWQIRSPALAIAEDELVPELTRLARGYLELPAPGELRVGVIAWVFVLYVGFLMPFMAWRSSRKVKRGAKLPPRMKLYASLAVSQAVLLAFAWITARFQGIELFPMPEIHLSDAFIGVAWVALKSLRLWSVLRRPEAMSRRRVGRHLAPRSPREVAGYAGLLTITAVAEEAAYRGVLFQIGLFATGSFWIAGLASAVVFGLGHLTQGRRPAVVAGIIGFGNQVIVLLTGSLWVVIAAHFAYDLLAGLAMGRVGRWRGSGQNGRSRADR